MMIHDGGVNAFFGRPPFSLLYARFLPPFYVVPRSLCMVCPCSGKTCFRALGSPFYNIDTNLVRVTKYVKRNVTKSYCTPADGRFGKCPHYGYRKKPSKSEPELNRVWIYANIPTTKLKVPPTRPCSTSLARVLHAPRYRIPK